MATSKPITHDKIAEEGIIKNYLQKEFEELTAYLPTVEASITGLAKKISSSLKNVKIDNLNVEGLQKLNDQIKQTNDLENVNATIKKAKIQLSEREQAQEQIDKSNKKDRIAALKAEIIEMDKTVGTLQRVEAANVRLRIERKNLNTETAEGKKRLIELNAELDKNNKYIIENSDKLKQQKLNVGNYTESIKAAFEGTGELGEVINKYLKIVEQLAEKIEAITVATGLYTESEKTHKVATEANIVVEETKKDIIVESTLATEAAGTATIELSEAEKASAISTTEANIAAKANTASLETETIATEAATVASEGLGKSLKALATNPFVLAAVAVAALAKVVYDNVTATQAQKDAWEAGEEGAKAFAKGMLVAGVNATQLASDIRKLTLEEFKKQDLEIEALTLKKRIAEEAAEAINQAAEENKTTAERIALLKIFIDKTKEGGEVVAEELQKEVEIKRGFVEKAQGLATREQRRALQEALANENQNKIDVFNSTRKAQLQITTLTEKYYSDLRKLSQEAQKEDLESIDTYSDLKASKEEKEKDQNLKELDKNLKLLKLESKQKIDNLKIEQEKLGAIDAQGVDHTEEFEKEILSIKKLYVEKQKELIRKTADDNLKIDVEIQIAAFNQRKKIEEEERKYEIEALSDKYGEAEKLIAKQEIATKIELGTATPEEIEAYYNLWKSIRQDNESEFIKYELEALKGKYGEAEKLIAKQEIATKIELGTATPEEIEAYYTEIRNKQIDEAAKTIYQITKGIEEGLKKRSEIIQAADQRDIDLHQRMVDVQAKLAAEGRDNVLAETLAQTAKAEEKKLQDAKKAAKQQEALALIETFEKTLQAGFKDGKPFLQAFREALVSEGLVSAAFSKLFAGFKDGIEKLDGPGNETSDSIPALLSKGESVATAKGTKENPGLVTAINKGTVDDYFENIYLPQYNAANSSSTGISQITHDEKLAQIVISELRSVKNSVDNKPVQNVRFEKLSEWDEEIKTATIKTVIHHKKSMGRPSLRLHG